jgi:EAL domain-containing protein (putative c-di-GMP-specific phosphodiesterase class I)
VAEGVETQGQLDFLKTSGCDEYQGYLFARPITATEMSAMFKARKAA